MVKEQALASTLQIASTSMRVRRLISNSGGKMPSHKREPVEIDCYAVRRELVNYMGADLAPELRARIDCHLQNCVHYAAVYDGVRNVVRLLGSKESIELPQGLSRRLYRFFLPASQ